MLVNKVILLPENDLVIKSVISAHWRFKLSTNLMIIYTTTKLCVPPTPDRRQSKTFLTIDERHRRQGIWTPPLLKNHKNIGFPKQYWSWSPEQSQSYKCTKPAFNVGPCGGSLAGRWWPAYCGIWILSSPLINLKKVVKSGPPWIRAWTPIKNR